MEDINELTQSQNEAMIDTKEVLAITEEQFSSIEETSAQADESKILSEKLIKTVDKFII